MHSEKKKKEHILLYWSLLYLFSTDIIVSLVCGFFLKILAEQRLHGPLQMKWNLDFLNLDLVFNLEDISWGLTKGNRLTAICSTARP